MRPPNRLAEPGRICSVVTPPLASARLKPGSCGQTLCSAQTCAVTGSVTSLPSECASHAGRGIVAEMAVDVDDAGRHPFARAVDHRRAFGDRGLGAADRGHLAFGKEDDAIVDARRPRRRRRWRRGSPSARPDRACRSRDRDLSLGGARLHGRGRFGRRLPFAQAASASPAASAIKPRLLNAMHPPLEEW